MLQYAGVGVAMGGASDNVKAHADYIAETVENDGIARTVEHFAAEFGLS